MEDLVCIDTDIIIDHLRGKGLGVKIFEDIIRNKTPFTTYVNKFELLCGAKNKNEIQIINECLLGITALPFDQTSTEEAGKIYRDLKKKGNLIGIRDIMIAGIAKANKLTIATRNLKDFKRILGLRFLNVS